jgi:hypothetical protein
VWRSALSSEARNIFQSTWRWPVPLLQSQLHLLHILKNVELHLLQLVNLTLDYFPAKGCVIALQRGDGPNVRDTLKNHHQLLVDIQDCLLPSLFLQIGFPIFLERFGPSKGKVIEDF